MIDVKQLKHDHAKHCLSNYCEDCQFRDIEESCFIKYVYERAIDDFIEQVEEIMLFHDIFYRIEENKIGFFTHDYGVKNDLFEEGKKVILDEV